MIQQFLVILGATIIIVGLMLLSLKFSKYKERSSGCCGGGHCSNHGKKEDGHSCCENHSH